jgi:outer membrane lipoprotein-sorting protein
VYLLLCGLLVFAQSPVFQHPLNGANRPRFIQVCDDLAKHPVIKGNFEQIRTISRLNRSLVSRGAFIIAADLGMVWDTKTPFPSTMAVGRDFMVQSTPSGVKTKMDARGNETFLRMAETISSVFSGNAQRLLGNFDTYFEESRGIWTIGLVPSEKSIRSFAAQITMSGDSALRSIHLYEQNGDSISYTLSDHTYPQGLSTAEKALFSVD